jgi:hypothetical protein
MDNNHSYWTYRLKLEKTKQRTLTLIVIARVLFILALVILHYWR